MQKLYNHIPSFLIRKKYVPSPSEKNHTLATERKTKQKPQNYKQQKPNPYSQCNKKFPIVTTKVKLFFSPSQMINTHKAAFSIMIKNPLNSFILSLPLNYTAILVHFQILPFPPTTFPTPSASTFLAEMVEVTMILFKLPYPSGCCCMYKLSKNCTKRQEEHFHMLSFGIRKDLL